MKRLLQVAVLATAVFLCGCERPAPRNDTKPELTPAQASGQRLFQAHCAECHKAYSSSDLHGPSLQGVFKKKYLPSGTPANDDRVREVINLGRSKMPAFGGALTSGEVDEIIAYLHTL